MSHGIDNTYMYDIQDDYDKSHALNKLKKIIIGQNNLKFYPKDVQNFRRIKQF